MSHPLYGELTTLDAVRGFMERHVFAVWDFMSLLKSMQRHFTCVDMPWMPRGDRTARRLINEIVLAEESDEDVGGGFASHFELYRAAMAQCNANASGVDSFLGQLATGAGVRTALLRAAVPDSVRRFVESTFDVIESKSIPRIAGAFALGREDIIPDMFVRVVADMSRHSNDRLSLLLNYLERHVHLDGEKHGPMAANLVASVCGDDARAWQEVQRGARLALQARCEFWDAIASTLASPARGPMAHLDDRVVPV